MRVRIQRNQIHLFQEEVEGQMRDILELGVSSVDYPHLPTYGIRVDATGVSSNQELKDILKAELLALIDRVQAQMQRDETVRGYFDEWGWLEFDTDNL